MFCSWCVLLNFAPVVIFFVWSELQNSRREVTRQLIMDPLAWTVRYGRYRLMFRSWKYANRHTRFTCCSLSILVIKVAPRFFTLEVDWITESPMWSDTDSSCLACVCDANSITSVLSVFSFNILWFIQDTISDKQCSKRLMASFWETERLSPSV